MIDYAKIEPSDNILEIGGGLGILTGALEKTGANITTIEIDPRMKKFLEKEFPDVTIIGDDGLKINWSKNIRVISNLPYSIATPVIVKILHHDLRDATIMIQKEVA